MVQNVKNRIHRHFIFSSVKDMGMQSQEFDNQHLDNHTFYNELSYILSNN